MYSLRVTLLLLFPSLALGQPELDALARCAVEVGQASYRDVLLVCYGDSLEGLLAVKADYRARNSGSSWHSDYSTLDRIVTVVVGPPDEQGRLVRQGLYTTHNNTARIPAADAGSNLAHEVGHSLALDTIRALRSKSFVDGAVYIPRMDPVNLASVRSALRPDWLRYVVQQAEIEVRMQGLNRLAHTLDGQAILDPLDAARALQRAGADIQEKALTRALTQLGVTLSRERIQSLTSTPKVPAETMADYPEAAGAAQALRMARLWSNHFYATLLVKLLRETPGHL